MVAKLQVFCYINIVFDVIFFNCFVLCKNVAFLSSLSLQNSFVITSDLILHLVEELLSEKEKNIRLEEEKKQQQVQSNIVKAKM